MAFPTIIVALFFITLNFNPKVLYAPSDFRNEENFLNTLIGHKELSGNFQSLTKQLEVAKQQIVTEAVKQVGAAGESERRKLANIVGQQIDLVKEKVESTRESAEELTLEAVFGLFPRSELQAKILSVLIGKKELISVQDIAAATKRDQLSVERALEKLAGRGAVTLSKNEAGDFCAQLSKQALGENS
jgi:uncharacterized tellurite resistance protein B-like protein